MTSPSATPAARTPSAFPLPPELFISVCANLDTNDLIAASQVCRAWRQTILDAPLLWSELDGIDLTRAGAVERVKGLLGRATSGLRAIEFGGAGVEHRARSIFEDDERTDLMVGRFEAIFAAVAASDAGSRSLRGLTLNLDTMDDDGGNLGPINIPLLNVCESVATGLTDVTLTSRYTTFAGGQPWFRLLPSLRSLTVVDAVRHDQAPEPWDGDDASADGAAADGPVALERWMLSGGCLPDPVFRPMPKLTSLSLLNTAVPCLASLLAACAPSLRKLRLAGTNPNDYEPDAPAPLTTIILPALRSAHIGPLNSPLWLESADFDRAFEIRTPALEEVRWGRTPCCARFAGDEEGVELESAEALDAELLRIVVQSCPNLRHVDVDDVDEESEALADCLAAAGPSLRDIVLGNRVTPAGLNTLANALPGLELLSLEGGHVTHLTLAHVMQAFRQSSSWAKRTQPLTLRLTPGRPPGPAPSLAELRATVVWHLQRAAATHPGADAVHEMVASIEPCLAPGDYSPACGGSLARWAEEVAGMVQAGKPLTGWALPRGSVSDVFRDKVWVEAEEVLAGWFTRRIEEAAREWLGVQEDIVLECEEGEASGADDDDSSTSSAAGDD